MSKYDVAIFDLDGTIACSASGIYSGIRYAVEKMGLIYKREHESDVIGPSLYYTFEAYYGLSKQDATKAVEIYREYYNKIGYKEFYLYEGIEQCLLALKENGVKLAIATTKNNACALKMMRYAQLEPLFDYIIGSNADGSRTDKKELIENVITHFALSQQRYVMIGDRAFDGEGASACGVDFIWASYGFGTAEEINALKPIYIARKALSIKKFILE